MGTGTRIGACVAAAVGAASAVLAAVLVLAPSAQSSTARSSAAIVDTFARTNAAGVWSVDSSGVVVGYEGAPHYGDLTSAASLSRDPTNASVVAAVATISGDGYWLVAADSAVYAFGDARHYGSLYQALRDRGMPASAENVGLLLDGPVFDIVRRPGTDGYWLVARDGGVFAFGAPFLGSLWHEIHGRGRTAVDVTAAADGMSYEVVDDVGNLYRCTGACRLVSGPAEAAVAQDEAIAHYRAMASDLNCVQTTKPDFAGGDLDGDGEIVATEWTAYATRVQPWYQQLAAESARFAEIVRRADWPGLAEELASTVADWADADAFFYAGLAEADFDHFFELRETASRRPDVWNDLRDRLGLPDAEDDPTDWCTLAAQT